MAAKGGIKGIHKLMALFKCLKGVNLLYRIEYLKDNKSEAWLVGQSHVILNVMRCIILFERNAQFEI